MRNSRDHHLPVGAAAGRALSGVAGRGGRGKKAYPHKPDIEILQDLIATTPGEEGKWFAAAKDAGLYGEALALARRTPPDPRVLARAARDFAVKESSFALEAGLLSLHWMARGYGYELTGGDVLEAYQWTMQAAERAGVAVDAKARVQEIMERGTTGGRFVSKALKLGMESRNIG